VSDPSPARRLSGILKAVESFLIRRSSIGLVEEHYIVTSALSEESTAVDLGANLGRFSSELAERFSCACVALEPAPENAARIPEHPRVQVVQGAIAPRSGTGELRLAADCTANRLTLADPADAPSGDAACITVALFDYPSLLQAAGVRRVDLLKVDVEGAEWDFFDSLTDLDLLSIGQITVEFHDFIEELGEARRTWQVYQRLLGLGFRCVEDPATGSYNVLFVHPALEMSFHDRLLIAAVSTLQRCAWKLDRVRRTLLSSPIPGKPPLGITSGTSATPEVNAP
jgi:FkbM family methyltransferase